MTSKRLAMLYAGLALGAAFLSAVAARFGLWDHRPHPFAQFIQYTREVSSFLPAPAYPYLAPSPRPSRSRSSAWP